MELSCSYIAQEQKGSPQQKQLYWLNSGECVLKPVLCFAVLQLLESVHLVVLFWDMLCSATRNQLVFFAWRDDKRADFLFLSERIHTRQHSPPTCPQSLHLISIQGTTLEKQVYFNLVNFSKVTLLSVAAEPPEWPHYFWYSDLQIVNGSDNPMWWTLTLLNLVLNIGMDFSSISSHTSRITKPLGQLWSYSGVSVVSIYEKIALL